MFKEEYGTWEKLQVPCGRCHGCRLEKSRQWAVRCFHEAQLHKDNSFLTLTYDEAHLPHGGTLIKKHYQDFMKRLRRFLERKLKRPLAPGELMYFHCGEYGAQCKTCRKSERECCCPRFAEGIGRPHYHAVLFGLDFLDKVLYRTSRRGDQIFTSAVLSKLWGKGHCTIGAVTFESAAYTARYIMKKINGDDAKAHYTVVDDQGEMHEVLPEYVTMSLKPTVGRNWAERYSADTYPDDFVVVRGKRMKPPKFYDRLYEEENPEEHARLRKERIRYARKHKHDATPERLAVREKVKLAQISNLKRTLDE